MQLYRNQTETLLDQLMAGNKDINQHTILDWIRVGAFVDPARIPSVSTFEKFFLGSLVGSTINSQWKEQGSFYVLRYATDDPDSSGGPVKSRWYDDQEKAVYHTYMYKQTGHLKGYQDAPAGLDTLSSNYSILGSDISKSSARAWQMERFNFNQSDSFKLLTNYMTNPKNTDPFLEGPGWAGIFSLAVCDMGSEYNWNTQYGDSKNGKGFLPCCCGKLCIFLVCESTKQEPGTKCQDTKAFIQSANMTCLQTLIHFCKETLPANVFDSIDYGYSYHSDGSGC
jgi:hypothetical protein